MLYVYVKTGFIMFDINCTEVYDKFKVWISFDSQGFNVYVYTENNITPVSL